MSQSLITGDGVPIVAHHEPAVPPGQIDRALSVAEALLREQPGLRVHSTFEPLVPRRLGEGSSLVATHSDRYRKVARRP